MMALRLVNALLRKPPLGRKSVDLPSTKSTLVGLTTIRGEKRCTDVSNASFPYLATNTNFLVLTVEEVYGKSSSSTNPRSRRALDSEGDISSNVGDSSSTSEDEDDEAVLATEQLDAEISATLQAIKSKDPRVYDDKTTFYTEIDDGTGDQANVTREEKPMFLRDYHRKNLLEGHVGGDDGDDGDNGDEAPIPRTYAQEQLDLQRDVVKEMHAAADQEADSAEAEGEDSTDEDGGFLVPKGKPTHSVLDSSQAQRKAPVDISVERADKDPESFLSNLMSSRAWVPTATSNSQPFDSDDEDEDGRAEAFEQAYNLRFEDPKGANEKLMSHARDAVAKYSVRREETSGRKKIRETQREKKEAEAREKMEEKARWRKLKVEEAEERVKRIKEAAGLKGKTIKVDQWRSFLDSTWDDEQWETEMKKQFGDEYYAAREEGDDSADGREAEHHKEKKVKKPKWDDDIDIKDLIPDFDDTAEQDKPPFTLSDKDEMEHDNPRDADGPSKRKKMTKGRVQERREQQKASRIERKAIEEFVDDKFGLDLLPTASSSKTTGFRYRETSPLAYGLTARDILVASDSQLNQYAGLKKLATFRDSEKKRKDKKRLGKKARLRQWRKETFGDERGPKDLVPEPDGGAVVANNKGGVIEIDRGLKQGESKKRKRSKKGGEKSVEG